MSVEKAIDFLKKLENDDSFVKEMSAQANKDKQVQFVQEQGFTFSVAEFQAAIHEHVEKYLTNDEIAGFAEGALLPGTLRWWKDLLKGGPNPNPDPGEEKDKGA